MELDDVTDVLDQYKQAIFNKAWPGKEREHVNLESLGKLIADPTMTRYRLRDELGLCPCGSPHFATDCGTYRIGEDNAK